jgi:hypothetical protein
MDLSILFKRVGKVAAENSPAILAALGVSGTLTTAYLAAKAGFQSVDVLKQAEEEKAEKIASDERTSEELSEEERSSKLTPQEKFETVWKLYAPAAASAALTVSAIVLAVRVQERRNAALAAAYTTIEKSYSEYRAKNVEKLGKQKEQKLRDEIAQDQVNRHPASQSTIIITGNGDTLCRDGWSDRYFNSSLNLIERAVNDANAQINKHGYVSLSEFWSYLGIPPTDESDIIGWRDQIEIDITGVVDDKGEPAVSYSFRNHPDPRFMSAY